MSLEGRLEDLSLADIFEIVHLSKKTGTLTVNNDLSSGRIVFQDGQILYASLQYREKLGERLLREKLIKEKDLEAALRIQKNRKTHEPLGSILVENKLVDTDVLDEILREQLKEVVYEILSWEEGSFKFEPEQSKVHKMSVGNSMSPEYLLLEGSRLKDEGRSGLESLAGKDKEYPVENRRRKGNHSDFLVTLLEEFSQPVISTEVMLMILRFAGEVLARAVLFIVRENQAEGFGQVGLSISGADQKIKGLRVPLDKWSVIGDVVNSKRGYRGCLEETDWNNYLVTHIGEGMPAEVFVVPVISGDKVIAVLYGDNQPCRGPIEDTAALEAFIKVAGILHEVSLQPSH